MSEKSQRLLNGIAIGVSACFGLTVLAIVLVARSSPPPASRGNPPTPTENIPESTLPPTTSEPTDIPGPLPTETPAARDSVQAHIIGDPTNLREGPSLDSPLVASLPVGTQVSIIGRWEDWYVILWPDAPNGTAWAYTGLIQVDGDASLIPTVEPPPQPPIPGG